jgi:predicted nucleic acid-binding protein
MGLTTWLADKSALARIPHSPDARLWAERIDRGLVAVTTLTLLEVGYSTRSGAELREVLGQPPVTLLPVDHLTPTIEERAVEVQTLLGDRGTHRAPSVADLLIAATAERTGRTVLHVDKDFELIADVTGQPVERLRV